jgi:hypothetical protein
MKRFSLHGLSGIILSIRLDLNASMHQKNAPQERLHSRPTSTPRRKMEKRQKKSARACVPQIGCSESGVAPFTKYSQKKLLTWLAGIE